MSFALGLPLGDIFKLPERHLRVYADYAAEFGLPTQRAEIYAAQNAYVTAASMGGYKGKISDFLLRENQQNQEVDVFADFDPD